MADTPMPGLNEFSADEEKAMRQAASDARNVAAKRSANAVERAGGGGSITIDGQPAPLRRITRGQF